MIPDPTCSSCRFWDPIAVGASAGLCRVESPRVFADTVRGRWPETGGAEWCGEHRWREPPPPPIAKDPGRGIRHAVNAVEGEVPTE